MINSLLGRQVNNCLCQACCVTWRKTPAGAGVFQLVFIYIAWQYIKKSQTLTITCCNLHPSAIVGAANDTEFESLLGSSPPPPNSLSTSETIFETASFATAV